MRRYLAIVMASLWVAGVSAGGEAVVTRRTTPAPARPGGAKLLKVLTRMDDIQRIVRDDAHLWFATWGGVKMLNRPTGTWRFFTRHDGLASNSIASLSVHDGKVYAFDGWSNQVSILEEKGDKWTVRLLGEKFQRGRWYGPWLAHVVRPDGIWCVFTGLPDNEWGMPSAIEIQHYDLKTFHLLKSIDVLKQLPESQRNKERIGSRPLGLVFVDGTAWIATAKHLVKLDVKSWKTEVVSLPAEADWDYIYDGHQAKQRRPNAIRSIAAGDKCLWLGLEAGLAKYDVATGKFAFHFIRDAKPCRNIGIIVPQGRNLWFSGYRGTVRRLDLTTEKVETIATGAFDWISQLVVLDGEAWVAAGRPDGVSRVDLKTGKVTTIQHQDFARLDDKQFVLFENILCGMGIKFIEKNGRQVTLWGVRTLDLSTGATAFHRIDGPAVMIPRKDRIWLVSFNAVTPFFPLKGQLGKALGGGSYGRIIDRAPEVITRRKGKLYLRTTWGNRTQIWVFESATGKLELLFMVPEEWRRSNARIMGVTSAHVYLGYRAQSKQYFKRFDLSKRAWQDVARKGKRNDRVCESLGRIWWGSHDKLQAFKAGGDVPVKEFQLPGHYINRLRSGDDGSLEVVTQAAVLRYDGKTWRARPLPLSNYYGIQAFAGVDRAGGPTGQHVVRSCSGGSEIAIYRGKPDVVQASEAKLPVTVDADGTLHVPLPAKRN